MQARDESDQARRSRARTESPSAAGRGNAPSGTAGFFMDLQRKAGNRAVTEMIRTAGSTVERGQVSRMFLARKGGGMFNPKGLSIVVPERREYNGAIPRDYRLDGYVALSEASENYGMD